MFLKNCWYAAAFSDDLRRDTLFPIRIAGQPLVLYRTRDGGVVALEDRCCHRAAPLSSGELEGDDLRCLYHGLKYSPEGRCIDVPGQSRVPRNLAVRRFRVLDRHGWLWIWLGAFEQADAALIPDILPDGERAWDIRAGRMDYRANYQLLNDNLTDFSHVSYVHRNSFGANPEFAVNPPRITAIPRGLRFERWLLDGFKSESPLADTLGNDLVGETATWQTYDYLAPGILIFYVERHPRERVPADTVTPPTEPPLWCFRQAQAATPMDARTTRYLYVNAIPKEPGSDVLSTGMLQVFTKAFQEDLEMIEAQQRVIDEDQDRPFSYIDADEGPMRMRRLIERMIDAEADSDQPLLAQAVV